MVSLLRFLIFCLLAADDRIGARVSTSDRLIFHTGLLES